MALTRKFLSALGIEADKIDEIIENHTDTVNALKKERDQYKADAEKLPEVQKELDEAKKKVEAGEGEESYKAKYESVKSEYDQYKTDVKEKETKAKKVEAYRKLLKDANVSEKRIDSIIRVSDMNAVKLDKDGGIENADDLKKTVETEWSDFIVKDGEKGADTKTPPKENGGGNSGRQPSRAAQLAASYAKNLYGADTGKGESE